jgi:hypothetical protein
LRRRSPRSTAPEAATGIPSPPRFAVGKDRHVEAPTWRIRRDRDDVTIGRDAASIRT